MRNVPLFLLILTVLTIVSGTGLLATREVGNEPKPVVLEVNPYEPQDFTLENGRIVKTICVLPDTMYLKMNKDEVVVYIITCQNEVVNWTIPHPTVL